MRVLLLYYTQTGATADTVEAFAGPLRERGIVADAVPLKPAVPYPFPWKSVGRFFDVMPECVTGQSCEIQDPEFDAEAGYDLVVLFYPVWFLSPCLATRGFLEHPSARVLRNRKVITVVVSRNMWTVASEKVKRLLAEAGARHCDNISVTHQGPVWATFITIPRLLLFGKRDRLWKVFPPPGLGETELGRLRTFGESLAEQLCSGGLEQPGPFFAGMGATGVQERYLLPELCGVRIFEFFAGWIQRLENLGGKWLRRLGIYCFVFTLVCLIVLGIPLLFVIKLALSPLIKPRMRKYVQRLREPSDPPTGSAERRLQHTPGERLDPAECPG